MNDLEIIIPAYNSHKTITNTLESISIQENMPSYHVTIVNDCGENYEKIIKEYKDRINLDEITTPTNSGPGFARQYGIDNTKSKYILFIDSDDSLYDKNSIQKLYQKIDKTRAELVISSFIYNRDGESVVRDRDSVYLHGKIYKREYLEKNNIKFNNSRSNEDNGFNSLVFLLGPGFIVIDDITYIYNDYKDSITRRNNREFKFTGLEGYSYNINWAIEEAEKRDANKESIGYKSLEGLIVMYKNYNELYGKYDTNKILEWSKKIYEKYLKYKEYNTKYEKDMLLDNKPKEEHITFKEFKEKMDNL